MYVNEVPYSGKFSLGFSLFSLHFSTLITQTLPCTHTVPLTTLTLSTLTHPTLTLLTLTLGDNDARLPVVTSVSASPAGYVVGYTMEPSIASILTSISTSYYPQFDTNTVVNGMQLLSDEVVIEYSGSLSGVSLLPATEVVEFVLTTMVGAYTYTSAPYILDPTTVTTMFVYV